MAYNLFVAYDLMQPGQRYEAVRARIRSLGRWYQIQYSMFYLNTGLDPHQVARLVREVMDSNDRLTVILADGAVVMPGIPANDANAINTVWFDRIAA